MATTTTTKTARDLTAELAFLTRALKAPTLRQSVARLAERARAEGWTHEEFLAACLQREVAAREAHGGEGRVRHARFPARKSLEEFDYDHARSLKREVIAHLGTLDFVAARENVVFLGPPEDATHCTSLWSGTGKQSTFIAGDLDTQAFPLSRGHLHGPEPARLDPLQDRLAGAPQPCRRLGQTNPVWRGVGDDLGAELIGEVDAPRGVRSHLASFHEALPGPAAHGVRAHPEPHRGGLDVDPRGILLGGCDGRIGAHDVMAGA
jgi:IstB-like ATP binding protein